MAFQPIQRAGGDAKAVGVDIASGESCDAMAEAAVGAYDGYAPLVQEIMTFFQTGKAPVPTNETIAIYAFMEAADESKRRDGAEVTLADVLEKAK